MHYIRDSAYSCKSSDGLEPSKFVTFRRLRPATGPWHPRVVNIAESPANGLNLMEPQIFAGSPLDRAANLRRDADWLKNISADADSRFVPFWDLKPLISPGDAPAIRWLGRAVLSQDDPGIFLGLGDGIAHFAIDVGSGEATKSALEAHGEFIDLRTIAPRIAAPETAILAQARSLVDWHARHRFCAQCGQGTEIAEGGGSRHCSNQDCGAQHFPRTDPVAIMLVTSGERCLLGRNGRFPEGFLSALAGFIETGETIEEAVRREILEEAGIEVGAVRYFASQPWPFPSSLMIGCFAEALSTDITVDTEELEEARWIERAEIKDILEGRSDGPVFLPPPLAIAHHLIKDWALGG